ncbi:MAG: hypothetical protein RBT74_06205 [Tenuifilaceae bacterium]|jgi:hypothetical protein|nr:hypothetical protein [Tenuifilaceae bacterium]
MHRFVLPLTFFLFASYVTLGQKPPRFSTDVLNSPIQHAAWFDNMLELVYVDTFTRDTSAYVVSLENGYAQHRFANQPELIRNLTGFEPVSIDIVYTKYPFSKEDWQTNYYDLLANRLKELFQHDPTLNSREISWRLVMQTNCINGEEATQLFHGIVINYKLEMLAALPIRKFSLPILIPKTKVETTKPMLALNVQPPVNEKELIALLYPQSVYNREMKQHIPAKTRTKNEPGCSNFTTRADRPKSSVLARLFGR